MDTMAKYIDTSPRAARQPIQGDVRDAIAVAMDHDLERQLKHLKCAHNRIRARRARRAIAKRIRDTMKYFNW